MKIKKSQVISLKVILLFSIAILSTFIGDYLHEFFDDYHCDGSGNRVELGIYEKCNYGEYGIHGPTWHWGYRHWLYLCMCIVLFIIQVVDIVKYAQSEK